MATVKILTATRAGLYLFESDVSRTQWENRGPFLADFDIHHAVFDRRDASIWAAANGPENRVYRSPDSGESWQAMGAPFECDSIWHVEPGQSLEPQTVFAGLKPAALWNSSNGGESWEPV